jgi:hypothetical protein
MRRHLAPLAVCLFALFPSAALARSAQLADPSEPAPETAAETAPTSPSVRIDVAAPAIGIGATTAHGGAAIYAGAGAVIMDRSGHGARVLVGVLDTDPALRVFSASPSYATTFFVDASYDHPFRLLGDDRLGLGLDVYGGLSIGNVQFHQPSAGFCWSSCTQPPTETESVADGWHGGANAGASLDFRASVFVIGVDVRGRALFALERVEANEHVAQADVSASLHVGFGFY